MTSSNDRKPLLQSPQRFHTSHGLAPPPIRFPTSTTASKSPQQESGGQDLWRSARGGSLEQGIGTHGDDDEQESLISIRGRRGDNGLPKITRECLWS